MRTWPPAYLAGRVKVWLTGLCAGRLPVKIQVSLLKYARPAWCGHG
jgi:hypothetical protein